MSIFHAIAAGKAGNELSKAITGSDEVSLGRSTVAVGSGAVLGAASSGAVVVGAAAVGLVAAPITVPLAVAGALIGGLFSLFD